MAWCARRRVLWILWVDYVWRYIMSLHRRVFMIITRCTHSLYGVDVFFFFFFFFLFCECVYGRLMSTTQFLGVYHTAHGLLQCNNIFFFLPWYRCRCSRIMVGLIMICLWMNGQQQYLHYASPSIVHNDRTKYKFCADWSHITTEQSQCQ